MNAKQVAVGGLLFLLIFVVPLAIMISSAPSVEQYSGSTEDFKMNAELSVTAVQKETLDFFNSNGTVKGIKIAGRAWVEVTEEINASTLNLTVVVTVKYLVYIRFEGENISAVLVRDGGKNRSVFSVVGRKELSVDHFENLTVAGRNKNISESPSGSIVAAHIRLEVRASALDIYGVGRSAASVVQKSLNFTWRAPSLVAGFEGGDSGGEESEGSGGEGGTSPDTSYTVESVEDIASAYERGYESGYYEGYRDAMSVSSSRYGEEDRISPPYKDENESYSAGFIDGYIEGYSNGLEAKIDMTNYITDKGGRHNKLDFCVFEYEGEKKNVASSFGTKIGALMLGVMIVGLLIFVVKGRKLWGALQ